MRSRPSHYQSKYKHDLSPREREVLSLITRGKTNGEIAQTLGLAFDTVKWHVSEILGKLSVASREEAADVWRDYNSLGARLSRTLSGLVAPFTTKVAAIAAGSAVAVVVGIAVAAVVFQSLGQDDPDALVDPPDLAVQPRIGQPTSVGPAPTGPVMLLAGGALWYESSRGIERFDLGTKRTLAIAGTGTGNGISSAAGTVWAVAADHHGVVGLDEESGDVVRRIDFAFRDPLSSAWLLATEKKLYIAAFESHVVFRIDLESGVTDASAAVEAPKGMVMAGNSLWVPASRRDEILRLNPETLSLEATIKLQTTRTHSVCGSCIQGIMASPDSIWAVSKDGGRFSGLPGLGLGQVSRIDLQTNAVVATHRFEGALSDVFSFDSAGNAWIGVRRDGQSHGELVRIGASSNQIDEVVPLSFGQGLLDITTPKAMMVEQDHLWVLTAEGLAVTVRMAP